MALPVKSFTVANVAKPNIGENRPAQVIAEVYSHIISRLLAIFIVFICRLITHLFPLVVTLEESGRILDNTILYSWLLSHLRPDLMSLLTMMYLSLKDMALSIHFVLNVRDKIHFDQMKDTSEELKCLRLPTSPELFLKI